MNAYSGVILSNNSITPAVLPDYREPVSYYPSGIILAFLHNGNH
jgi:hypothetical protein